MDTNMVPSIPSSSPAYDHLFTWLQAAAQAINIHMAFGGDSGHGH